MFQPNKIIVRDLDRNQLTHYKSQGEAILAAILDLQTSGGGMLWFHRTACEGSEGDEGCLCDPVDVFIAAAEQPN